MSQGGGSEAGSGQGSSWTLRVQLPPTISPRHGGHLRAISNSSGSSVLSFCMAMSAMGPRITTGRLNLAVGAGQISSGSLGGRAEPAAPSPPAPLLEVPVGLGLPRSSQDSGAH